MTTNQLVKEQVHALVDTLPDMNLMTVFDFVRFLAARQEKEGLLEAQMQSTAYQEWVGQDNDIYDELFADDSTTR